MQWDVKKIKQHLANPEALMDYFCDDMCNITEKEDSISFAFRGVKIDYPKRRLDDDRYRKFTGTYMLYNEYDIVNIEGIFKVIEEKHQFVFFYYDNIEAFCAYMNHLKDKNIFALKEPFLLFFSEDDLEFYFKRSNCKYPRIYLDVPISIESFIARRKTAEVNVLRDQMDDYYERKELKNLRENLRILICSDLFNPGTVGCMARDYENSFKENGIDYELTIEDYDRFHYYEEVYFLRKVIEYKPTAVLAMNVSYASFPYYIHSNLPIISQIDSGQYAANENCFRHKGLATIFILPFATIENVHSKKFIQSESFKDGCVIIPFVSNEKIFKKYNLTQAEKDKYDTDICIVGNSTTSREVLQFDIINAYQRYFMKDAKEEERKAFESFINEIFEECFDLTYQKDTFIGYDQYFKKYIIRKLQCSNILFLKRYMENIEYFVLLLTTYFLLPIYRISIMDWIIEKGYDVKLYGMRWNRNEKYRLLWCGEVKNGEELSKIYNASKIVIHSNLVHGVHRRFFEATLSGCLCLCPRPIKECNFAGLDAYFEENEEIIYFDNKRELYQKIDYFLAHPKQRDRIIENCQRVIREKELYSNTVLSKAIYRAISKIEKNSRR